MTNQFATLGLSEAICKAVHHEGYETPTPIQEKAIPTILEGRDLIGCAQTGTGKTAAFALPILQKLSENRPNHRGIRALILAPTRELALQVSKNFVTYGKNLQLKTVVVFGGVGLEPQIKALRRGADIVVATPGRLMDLYQRRCVDLRNLDIFVLDEADRMLDMGFINDIKRIISLLPTKKQSLLFSATIPTSIQNLIHSLLNDPVKVEVARVSSANVSITQSVYFVDKPNKRNLLLHILNNSQQTRALIFTRTKHNANHVCEFLRRNKFNADAIHGNKSQGARQKALENFRKGATTILVASDIASRGIDIDDISHVFNFDIPEVAETYIHRIGRTGRAQAVGEAISFCDASERSWLVSIERLMKKEIPVVEDHPFPAENKGFAPPPPRGGSRPRRGGGGGHRHGGGGGRRQSGGGDDRGNAVRSFEQRQRRRDRKTGGGSRKPSRDSSARSE